MSREPPTVAVFGSSRPAEGDPSYDRARQLGRGLGRAGFRVLTGGYGGVMEGANRGASEVGAPSIGVSCEIFAHRRPNPYLSEEIESPDLHLRTRELIERADAFVVLPGSCGTLAELTFLWALARAGCLGSRPVIMLGTTWPELLGFLEQRGVLDDEVIATTGTALNPEEAVQRLAAHLLPGSPERP